MTMKTLIIVALLCMVTVSAGVASNASKPAITKKPSKAGAVAPVSAPARTLDAIRIEGEIDVPQVLFITARDYRRFRDGTPARYQTTSADIAKSVPLPKRVRVVAPVE
jgi:TolA-binding protein